MTPMHAFVRPPTHWTVFMVDVNTVSSCLLSNVSINLPAVFGYGVTDDIVYHPNSARHLPDALASTRARSATQLRTVLGSRRPCL